MIREGCLSPGILCLNTSYASFCEFSNELVDSFDLFRYEGTKKIAAVNSGKRPTYLSPANTFWRLGYLEGLQPRGEVYSQLFSGKFFHGLLLGFHDVWQRGISRFWPRHMSVAGLGNMKVIPFSLKTKF
jgi:hypothetical protein